MNFVLQNELIYHVKNNKEKICISTSMKKMMLKTTHNDCNYAKYHRVYIKLLNTMYIHKLLRKLIIYIQYCSAC